MFECGPRLKGGSFTGAVGRSEGWRLTAPYTESVRRLAARLCAVRVEVAAGRAIFPEGCGSDGVGPRDEVRMGAEVGTRAVISVLRS